METLGKLFGSESKVKIMRLFLFNPEKPFDAEEVAERARVSTESARHELSVLRTMKLIKGRSFVKRILKQRGKKSKVARRKVNGAVLNPAFPYLGELERLLINRSLLSGDALVRKLGRAVRLKLLVISGIFIQDTESRVDLLIVGDHLKRAVLDHAIGAIEAEMGTELRYAAFETTEFNYRLGMYDKLIRDILEYPHKTVLDRLGIPLAVESRLPLPGGESAFIEKTFLSV